MPAWQHGKTLWQRTKPLWVGLVACLLVCGAERFPPWRHTLLKEFDVLTWWSAPRSQQFPIVIIGIDDNSQQLLGRPWPWPRQWHAKLIDALSRRGAQLIAFDVVFDNPSTEQDDAALSLAIRQSGNVVLASDEMRVDAREGQYWIRQEPLPRFIDAGATAASINIALDDDQVLRRKPSKPDALWRVLASRVATTNGLPLNTAGDYVRYLGPRQTFTYLSYYQALEPERYLPKFDFHNALVLVGRSSFTTSDVSAAQLDQLQTPFTLFDHQYTPGIEIHANLVETSLSGSNPLHAVPDGITRLAMVFSVGWLLALGWQLRARRVLFGLLSVMAVLPLVDFALFQYAGYWLPLAPSLVAAILTSLGLGLLILRNETQGRRAIRAMFSRYVPEKVVAQLISQPNKLALGGEQQRITLLFSDLAGFTDLAETLKPTEVGELLNAYFSQMTDVVFAHDGTLDKFIGDAIMAFWGAPLDDADQASKAIACARHMQAEMVDFNAARMAKGLAPLTMRIGLHTGSAIVGNLGSPLRFSYTAVGDAVNLAARLEGANKYYGTAILYSEDTARQSGHSGHRPVDTVRVKGKRHAVALFTPSDDTQLIAATEAAHTQYRAQQWAQCRQSWQDIATAWPNDTLASIYLERLELIDQTPLPADWDGAWTLDSK